MRLAPLGDRFMEKASMLVAVRGCRYTVLSAARVWLQAFWRRARRMVVLLGPGSLAASGLAWLSMPLARTSMLVFVAVVFVRQLCWPRLEGDDVVVEKPPAVRAVTAVVAGLSLLAVLHVLFARWHGKPGLVDMGTLLGTSLAASLLTALLATSLDSPFVPASRYASTLPEYLCPECGVIMEVTGRGPAPPDYSDQYLGGGRTVRTYGPLRGITVLRCPHCKHVRKWS